MTELCGGGDDVLSVNNFVGMVFVFVCVYVDVCRCVR